MRERFYEIPLWAVDYLTYGEDAELAEPWIAEIEDFLDRENLRDAYWMFQDAECSWYSTTNDLNGRRCRVIAAMAFFVTKKERAVLLTA